MQNKNAKAAKQAQQAAQQIKPKPEASNLQENAAEIDQLEQDLAYWQVRVSFIICMTTTGIRTAKSHWLN